MSMRDNNPRVYTLKVFEADAVPSPGRKSPSVVIEFQGSLSRKAKRDIAEAFNNGEFDFREKKKVVI